MSSTTALTGMLPFIVLVAAAMAFPACFLLLYLYRRSVRKAMASSSAGGTPAPRGGVAAGEPPMPLRIVATNATEAGESPDPAPQSYRDAVHGPWCACLVYGVAAVVYALLMTAGWLLATGDQSIVLIKLLVIFWTYLWPLVLTVLLVAAYDRGRRVQVFGVYFVVLSVLIAIAVLRNPDLGIVALPLYWIILNGPPTVLLLTFLLRRIRAVGPLVLAFMVAIAIGSQSILSVAGANEDLLELIAEFGFAIGLSGRGVFAAMIGVGMAVFSVCGWFLLRVLGRRYQRKRFSAQSIMLDSLWLLFAITQSIGLAFESPPWILTGLAAFAGYKLVARIGLRTMAKRVAGGKPKTLLLLRVFLLAGRSEKLFDKLRKHWPYAGSVSMIAGPDLVTSTVEPHEFLDFLSARLGRQFVSSTHDLQRRVDDMDKAADPDGRYRINEFFCHSNTWQMTMERLAIHSESVLMDLRSFSPANEGCVFELGRLLDSVSLNRVVFLVDSTTDRDYLEATLQRLWRSVSSDSPNRSVDAPTIRLFRSERQSESELKALLDLLTTSAPAEAPA